MNKIKALSIMLIFFTAAISLSCATIGCQSYGDSILSTEQDRDRLPRKSFLKIYRNASFKLCPDPEKPEECITKTIRTTGSGFLISNVAQGGFMMTAAHVCDITDLVKYVKSIDSSVQMTGDTMIVEDVDGNRFESNVLEMDIPADLCVAFVHGIRNPPVEIAYHAPRAGEEAWNLAAPVGFFAANVVPTLHGSYNGQYGRYASYTVPAVGGSSGSPVFNVAGEVIGMIHSVHTRFQFLTFSPTHKEIWDMASKYLNL